MNEMTGVVQRRISSVAVLTSDRSAARRAHSAGRSASAAMPPEIA